MTKNQKLAGRQIPERRPALSGVRDAVTELARLRNDMAHRRGARPVPDENIRQAIHEGRL